MKKDIRAKVLKEIAVQKEEKELEAQSLFAKEEIRFWWEKEWWGMPEFIQEDHLAMQQITLNFATAQDVLDFAKLIGQPVSPQTNSLWFPKQVRIEPKNFLYVNES